MNGKIAATSTILTPRAMGFAARELGVSSSDMKLHPVSGGYSLNRRAIVEADGRFLFVKEVDAALLEDSGDKERGWLRKDAGLMELLRSEGIDIVPEESTITDDGNVLVTTAYRKEQGWFWDVPEDSKAQQTYVDAVIGTASRLEQATFDEATTRRLGFEPYFRDEIAASDGLEALRDEAFRVALLRKYDEALKNVQLHESAREAIRLTVHMIEDDALIDTLIESKQALASQPNAVMGHCDLRPDNLAYNSEQDRVILVDWNWASIVPEKFGSTEFLISVASKDIDITDWYDQLNPELLAGSVGFWFRAALKPPLSPTSSLRDYQAVSAAVSFSLYREIAM